MAVELSDLVATASSHDVAASGGGGGFFQEVGDALQYGLPSAVVSGIAQIVNSAAVVGKAMNVTDGEQLDTMQQIDDLLGQDAGAYYAKHKAGVDIGGFVLGSLVPGTIGVKALKAAQAGFAGENMNLAMRLLTNTQQTKLVNDARAMLLAGDTTWKATRATRIQAIVAGAFEQSIEFGAFEAASILAMHQSPIYADMKPSDLLLAPLHAAALGGILGGLIISPLQVYRGLTPLRNQIDKVTNQAQYISTDFNALKGLDAGTRIASYLEELKHAPSIASIPEEFQKIAESALRVRQKGLEIGLQKELIFITGEGRFTADFLSKEVIPKMTRDQTAQWLTQATKVDGINPITDTVAKEAVPTFFKLPKDSRLYATLDEIPAAQRNAAEQYQLRRGTAVAEAGEYPTLIDAMAGGATVWRNAENQLHIVGTGRALQKFNKDTNAAFKASIMDLKTGDFVEFAQHPQFGDFYKKIEILNGEKLRLTTAEETVIEQVKVRDFTIDSLRELDPVDATKAWHWAKEANINTDLAMIGERDLPLIERAIIDPKIPDVVIGTRTYTKAEATELLHQMKGDLAGELLAAGRSMDDVTRILNTTEESLTSPTIEARQLLMADQKLAEPRYLKTTYSETQTPNSWQIRGWNHHQEITHSFKENSDHVAADVLGEAAAEFDKISLDVHTMSVSRGSGPGVVRGADANFLSVEGQSQAAGRLTHQEMQRAAGALVDTLGASDAVIRQGGQGSMPVVELNHIAQRIRDSKYRFFYDPENGALISNEIRKAQQNLERAGDNAIKAELAEARIQELLQDPQHFMKVTQAETRNYIQRHVEITGAREGKKKKLADVLGGKHTYEPGEFLVPAVDIAKKPHVMFVRRPAGSQMDDGEVVAVTARSAEELQEKIQTLKGLHPEYKTFTKDDTKGYFEARQMYEHSLGLQSYTIRSTLKNEGILVGDLTPKGNFDVLDEISQWHMRQERATIRSAVSLKFAKEFLDLETLARSSIEQNTSAYGYKRFDLNSVRTPYTDLIDQALAINRQAQNEASWWVAGNRILEEQVGRVADTVWDLTGKIGLKKISEAEAAQTLQALGIDDAYAAALKASIGTSELGNPIARAAVQKLNRMVAMFQLRLDYFQPLVNMISAPILSVPTYRTMYGRALELYGPGGTARFDIATGVAVPGTPIVQKSILRYAYGSIERFFQDAKPAQDSYLVAERLIQPGETYRQLYQRLGIVPRDIEEAHGLIDAATDLRGINDVRTLQATATKAEQKLGKVLQTLQKPSDWAERYTRYQAADVAMQMAEDLRIPVREIPGFLNTAVAQIQGTGLAFQRPLVFQGVLGQAIGLFQSYQFNLMQRAFRFMEAGDAKAVLMMNALQGTLYGMRGLPYFDALNKHLIGEHNASHGDIYSGTYRMVGKDVGDFLVYGAASSLIGAGVYTRGDVSPRNVLVLPTSPEDIPAVNIMVKAIGNMARAVSSIKNGAPLLPTFLQALEHNALSRPIQGLATGIQGFTTTNQGNVLSSLDGSGLRGGPAGLIGDPQLAWWWAQSMRVMGSRPLSEAIVLDTMYRYQAYQIDDAQKRKALGTALTKNLYAAATGEAVDQELIRKFAEDYAAGGGNMKNFKSWYTRQYLNAARPRAGVVADKFGNDAVVQNMQLIMGADTPPKRRAQVQQPEEPATE